MANPSVPAQASRPIPPPLATQPIGRPDPKQPNDILPTLQFLKQWQQLWAGLAGSGGVIENLDFITEVAAAPPFEYSSREIDALVTLLAAHQIPGDVGVPPYPPYTPSDPGLPYAYQPFVPGDVVPQIPSVVLALRVGYDYQVPLTGFSITLSNFATNLILDPAGTLATGTLTMPAAPLNAQICGVACSQAVTALTMNPNAGQTLNGGLTAFVGNDFAQYQYVQAITTWFRTG